MNYLYDGSGNRVAMMATVNGTTTLTAYIGSIEEVQTTTYYTVAGQRMTAKVNSALYYFGYDALGSQTLVLNSNGAVVGSQLYGPYGNRRYSNGTLPTSIGFTGQRADSVTGLDYYVARYYDPAVGVFLSPDSVQGNAQGMQPYAYVGGNPETRTDPTGQRFICPDCGGGGGGGEGSGGGSNPPPPPPTHGGGGSDGGGGLASPQPPPNDQCNTACVAKLGQDTAQQLRGEANRIQHVLDQFAPCSDITCILQDYFSFVGTAIAVTAAVIGAISLIIGTVAGPGGVLAGMALGGTIGGAVGAFAGLLVGIAVEYGLQTAKQEIKSELSPLRDWLNSTASTFDDQTLTVEGLLTQYGDVVNSVQQFKDDHINLLNGFLLGNTVDWAKGLALTTINVQLYYVPRPLCLVDLSVSC